ncbi:MAG: 30S ribosomal protein S4 [Thermoplasmatales archaeon]|nr:30S ribosomal protein S4 [Thermoplasmatales archaeon]
MGSPKFPKKKYNTPFHPWKESRIESERGLIKKYGLKNHKEVWKAKTYLGRYRQQARELLAKIEGKDPQVKKESEQLLLHLTRMGIVPAGSSLDDVLALETESVLSRRLQTLVFLKGFSTTTTQSRQLINHGHVAIGDRKVTIPSYMVSKDEETDIAYTNKSPLNELSHPARPKTDVYKTDVITSKIEKTEEETIKPKKEEKTEPDVKKEKTEEKKEETAEPIKEQEKTETKEEKKTEDKPESEKKTIEPAKKPEDAAQESKEEKPAPVEKQAESKNENKETDEKKEDK